MGVEAQVQKLEGLLARIQSNAAKPRAVAAAAPAAAAEPEPIEDLDIDDFEEVQEISDFSESEPPPRESQEPTSISEALGQVAAAGTDLALQDEAVVPGDDDDEFDMPTAVHGQPTMEQLGATVELQGADAPPAKLELVEPPPESVPPPSLGAATLEAQIPDRAGPGTYQQDLAPPAHADRDLQRHFGGGPASVKPEVQQRTPLDATRPVASVSAASPLGESSFLELLDASLGLGR